MKSRRLAHLDLLLRTVLGLVFIAASWNKIADPQAFARVIANYMILPASLINAAAVILPVVEMLCGILLVTGRLVAGSALIVNLLMTVFIAALAANVFRGININCGCFSLETGHRSEMVHYIVRDLFLLGTGLWVLCFRFRYRPFRPAVRN